MDYNLSECRTGAPLCITSIMYVRTTSGLCVVMVHLLYHLFMAAISLLCAHQSFCFLAYLLPPLILSIPALLRQPRPFCPSLSLFLVALGLSSFAPFLLLFHSFSLKRPVLLQVFFHISIVLSPHKTVVFSFHNSLHASIFPLHSAAGLLWKLKKLDADGNMCLYSVCAVFFAVIPSSCGSLTPDVRPYAAPPMNIHTVTHKNTVTKSQQHDLQQTTLQRW